MKTDTLNLEFATACAIWALKLNKRLFYAAAYGNRKAQVWARDLCDMFLMGGEI